MTDSENPTVREREVSAEDLQRLASGGHLYAVVDACSVPMVPRKVLELGDDRAISLYRETPEQDFWDVAPYLLKVDTGVLEWLRANASKEGWGIFVASKADLATLRHHFRHFLKVQAPDGRVWFFRFYDPRVLRPFLPACLESELETFFGPVLAYGVTDRAIENIFFFVQARTAPALADPFQQQYSFIFQLRAQHVEALQPQATRAFASEVGTFLRARLPHLVADLPSDVVEKRVLAGLNRARGYGFSRDATLAAFVGIMFELGPRFDEQPVIHTALLNALLPPDDRWNLMFSAASDEDWDQAEQMSPPGSWEKLLRGTR